MAMLPLPWKESKKPTLGTLPPSSSSSDYVPRLAQLAASILFRSPLPSNHDLPIFILNAAAFPDTSDVDYDGLLPYVLARLPDEDQLIGGKGYEIVFFAGGEPVTAGRTKKSVPGWGWLIQAYHALPRPMRKRLQMLYLVHEKRWVRIVTELFSSVVSPKFRKKIVHVSSLSALALHIPIEDLLIPPSSYLFDRRRSPDIFVPYASGKRAFGVRVPLPLSASGASRLPRVLREASSFLLLDQNLRTEGLFRVSPRALDVEILKEAYDRGQKFIIWREGESVLTFMHWKEGHGDVMADEVGILEGFGVYDAAGLIKAWYLQLKEPIFPSTAYPYLLQHFEDEKAVLGSEQILQLIDPQSSTSPLSHMARSILTRHLFPLLSCVAEQSDWNKMTSRNLAVCFAPSVLWGPDPIEDAIMGGILRRLFDYIISHWNTELASACGMDRLTFEESLRLPEAIADREDPLEQAMPTPDPSHGQTEGIVLVDRGDDDSDDVDVDLPPLPPRHSDATPASGDAAQIKRKPAPSLQTPPRYSVVFGSQDHGAEGLPTYQPVAEDLTEDVAEEDSHR